MRKVKEIEFGLILRKFIWEINKSIKTEAKELDGKTKTNKDQNGLEDVNSKEDLNGLIKDKEDVNILKVNLKSCQVSKPNKSKFKLRPKEDPNGLKDVTIKEDQKGLRIKEDLNGLANVKIREDLNGPKKDKEDANGN